MIKVLLVYPEFPVSFWSYKYAVQMLGKKASMPPLGLATVAAMLPYNQFDVSRIIDLNVEKLRDEQIKETDWVLISSMMVQKESRNEIANRAHFYGKKVIDGGPYPSAFKEELNSDHLILGEAESTLPRFLEDVFKGNARRIYEDRPEIPKPRLSNTPIPRLDLLNLEQYAAMTIQYSRGCPHSCEFCDIPMLFGREPRTKTPEQMAAEFNALYNTGWKGSVFIVDDNLIGNKKNVREMLPVAAAWQKAHHYPFSFFTEASMDLADSSHQDIREGMVEAGFDSVFLGIESTNLDVLEGMNKKRNISKNSLAERVGIIQKSGLEVMGGFIIGNDGEKPEVFNDLFNFIQETGIVVPMVGLLTAIKGTPLYDRLEREGRLRTESSGNNTHNLSFNFKPQLDEQMLIEGYAGLLKKLFEPKNYYERCRVLNACKGKSHSTSRTDFNGVLAFARVLYENVVRKPEPEFLKYLGEVMLTKPANIPEAVTHGVKRHHFSTITDGTLAVKDYRTRANELYANFQQKIDKVKGNAHERLDCMEKARKKILKSATQGYHRIHDDFKKDAREAFDKLKTKLEQYRQK